MKSKVLILIAATAIVTLSFTISTKVSSQKKAPASSQSQNEPAGGLLSEDKF